MRNVLKNLLKGYITRNEEFFKNLSNGYITRNTEFFKINI
jgi:hypothetical protein